VATETVVLTVITPDRPGVVQQLSDVIRAQGGNWLESSLSRLGGQFAGVVSVSIDAKELNNLQTRLKELAVQNIQVEVHKQVALAINSSTYLFEIDVEANDRTGIVEEISTALADQNINVEKITTRCESASMAGYDLFKARIKVSLQDDMPPENLEKVLENVSDDVMVTLTPLDGDGLIQVRTN